MQDGRAAVRAPAILTALAVLVFLLHCGRFWWFTIDDAAISMAYAYNAAHGHGLVLTAGAAPVEGFSNPLWVAMMVGPSALGAALEPVAKGLGVILAAGAMPMVVLAARRAGAGALAPVAAGVLALAAGFALWAQAGLENGLWAAGCAAALVLTLRELDDPAARPWSALPLALLIWIRPEAPLVLMVFAAVRAWVVWRRRLGWRRELIIALAVIAGGLALLALRRLLFHDWLPNSYYAKRFERITPALYFRRGRRYVWGYVRDYRLYLLAWVPLCAFLKPAARPAAALGLGLILAPLAFGWYAGGDWAHDYRFLTAAWIGLALLAALACAALAERVRGRVVGVALATALLGLFTWTAAARGSAVRHDIQFRITAKGRAADCHVLVRFSHLLGRERPLVLAVDAGGMSFCGSSEVLDYMGLADRTIPLLRDHDGSLREYLFAERAWDFNYGRGELPRALANTPEMHREYVMFHGRGWHPSLGLWVRRELVMATPDFPRRPAAPLGEGMSLVGARVTPTRARPGTPVLIELAVRSDDAVRAGVWPRVDLALRAAGATVARARAEGVPGCDGWSPLLAGDTLVLRARVELPLDVSGTLSIEAGGVAAGGLVVLGASAPAAPAELSLGLRAEVVAELLDSPGGAAIAARRLLALRAELDGVRARSLALGLPLPATPPALSAAGRVADRLTAEAGGLPPDAAYARLRLAARLAPKRATLVRALDAVRRRRAARYSFLEEELGYDLERTVALGDDAARDTLAAVYLDQGRDRDALAVAQAPCPRALAAANLALAAPPAAGCGVWDPVRARFALALPARPGGDLEGFEHGLAWTPSGEWPHATKPNDEHKTPIYRWRWSGEARAQSGVPSARGGLTSPPWLVRHHYLTFLLSTGARFGTAAPSPEGPVSASLVVDGQTVLTADAHPDELSRVVWDLSPWQGRTAHIQLTDGSTSTWLAADAFTWLAPTPSP